mmetsp:Transcript_43505/g.106831  ORF Transcript_43505/g.106831 Transcript_43505/m.106831 type:complete len:201 (-) Transcript_43505:22-624(-)
MRLISQRQVSSILANALQGRGTPLIRNCRISDMLQLEAEMVVSEASMPELQGHFPGAKVVPGVTTIEAFQQAAAVLDTIRQELGVGGGTDRVQRGPRPSIESGALEAMKLSEDEARPGPAFFEMSAVIKASFRASIVVGDAPKILCRNFYLPSRYKATAILGQRVAASAIFATLRPAMRRKAPTVKVAEKRAAARTEPEA